MSVSPLIPRNFSPIVQPLFCLTVVTIFLFYLAMSTSQLRKIPRLPLPPLTSKARNLFHPPAADMKLVTRLRARLAPMQTVLKSALRGTDAKLGLKLSGVKQGN